MEMGHLLLWLKGNMAWVWSCSWKSWSQVPSEVMLVLVPVSKCNSHSIGLGRCSSREVWPLPFFIHFLQTLTWEPARCCRGLGSGGGRMNNTDLLPASPGASSPRGDNSDQVINQPIKNKQSIYRYITWWQIDGETMETVTDFTFLGSIIIADGDCTHEIRRCLLLGRKAMTNLDSILKSRDITLPTKVHLVKAMVFPVVRYRCESWTIKKAECWRIDAFELWCWRRLLRVSWTARRSNSQS